LAKKKVKKIVDDSAIEDKKEKPSADKSSALKKFHKFFK
jgi:hypothetical protein